MSEKNSKPFRPCVVAVVKNDDNQLLVGERVDAPGSWQFPQGGIDVGESSKDALFRELKEETGCESVEILRQSSRSFKYRFPVDFQAKIAQQWAGQEQVWFLCKSFDAPDVQKATDKEFSRFRWMSPQEVLMNIIDFKKEVYQLALEDLQVLSL